MDRISFGIIGSGWRSEFYLRIARHCPERFEVAGMVVRGEEKGREFERQWGCPTFRTPEAMLAKTSPRFVVSSVPWDANPGVLADLARRGVPALSETPPAPDIPRMVALCDELAKLGAKAQVAEQVHLRPHHQAQMALARSGKIGKPSQAQISASHGYHGISLIRRFLGVRFEDATISASKFDSPIVQGAGRRGLPERETIRTSSQQFVRFDFGDRLGWLDFTGDQYFGTIRNERVLVRGERGEIANLTAHYLKDFRTPLKLDFVRHTTGINGDLGPNCLQGIQFGEEWVYRNPFAPAPLMDDEIAIAECLVRMDEYVRAGKDFYSIAEGCQDHYVNLVAQQSLEKGVPVRTERQPWAK